MAYDGERADGHVLDQLETILRHVAEELTGWRTRALKAEAELKESGARGGSGGGAAKLVNSADDLRLALDYFNPTEIVVVGTDWKEVALGVVADLGLELKVLEMRLPPHGFEE